MFDPLSLGLGAAASVGGGLLSGISKSRANADLQNQAQNWSLAQQQFNNWAAGNEQRQYAAADASRANTVNYLSADSQKQRQGAEQQRLSQNYTKGFATDPDTAMQQYGLSGQDQADPDFHKDLARKLHGATTEMRNRIGNLAGINSYGNSLHGLGTENPLALMDSAWEINRNNDYRRGNLNVLRMARAIPTPQMSYQEGAVPQMLSRIGGTIVGNELGNLGAALKAYQSFNPFPAGNYFDNPQAWTSPQYQRFATGA